MPQYRSLAAPISLALAICCVAPFWGDIQEFLKEALGGGFAPVFGLAFLVSAGGLLLLVVRQIQEHRGWRYGLLLLTLALAAAQIVSTDRGFAEIPERLHLPLYGLLSFLFYRTFKRPQWHLGRWATLATLLAVVTVGLVDEWVQTIVVARTGELYDVSLNLFAGVLGSLVALAYYDFEGLSGADKQTPAVIRTVACLVMVCSLALGVLFHAAHAGYRIDDPELGTFFTYQHPGSFSRVNQEKAAEWAQEPPGPDWKPLELQDNFRIEAGWRVQHRNASHDAGDWFSAWRENLILERYFPAFLTTPNRRGESYAFSQEQIANLERNARDDGRAYLSPPGLEPRRIFARPTRVELWMVIGSLIAACLLAMALANRAGSASEGPG